MAKLCEYGDKLATMSAQEVFNAAVEHLLTQAERSMVSGRCVYDGGENLCCAAAPFIKTYDKGFEGREWGYVVANGFASDSHVELIKDLQGVHDNIGAKFWSYSLARLAGKYDLSITKILELSDV